MKTKVNGIAIMMDKGEVSIGPHFSLETLNPILKMRLKVFGILWTFRFKYKNTINKTC